jgi:histidinol-phosphate phosphatase family protein
MSVPALFLDRDGIFNELVYREGGVHSPRNWDEVKHYPMDGLHQIKELGFKLVMVTNQPDIERNIISRGFVDELNKYYQNLYSLDKIYVSPFASNEHPLKKPNPGLFLLAKTELDIDFSASFLLGDTEKDTLAAKHCGIKSILWKRAYNRDVSSVFSVTSIEDLKAILSKFVSAAST